MIKINKRSPISPSVLLWPEDESILQSISLTDLFEDSALSKLYFSAVAETAISQWIALSAEEQTKKPESIVEKGGILLGSYRTGEEGYETLVHTFAPIRKVDFQSNTLWRVDKGIVPAILTATEEYGDQLVVGWLHTHPGHGPFLSLTDLEQTHFFFPHAYQIAIVIDPLVEEQPTGLFTRRADGSMNNAEDQQQWLNWKTFTTNT